MATSLTQYASQLAQKVYFDDSRYPFDRFVVNNDLVGLNSLGRFEEQDVERILLNSSYCNRMEVFDFMLENYPFPAKVTGKCVPNLAFYGEVEKIKKILEYTNISLELRITAFEYASLHNQIQVVSLLLDGEKIPKKSLLALASKAEERGYSDLKDLFQNAMSASGD